MKIEIDFTKETGYIWTAVVRTLTLKDMRNTPKEDAQLEDWLKFYCQDFRHETKMMGGEAVPMLDIPVQVARAMIEKAALFLAESIMPQEIPHSKLDSTEEEKPVSS